jgi:ABC-type sugar transport system substrate-binding protein
LSNRTRALALTGALALSVSAVGGAAVSAQSPAASAGAPIKIGLVVHAFGNPFIQQIIDAAQMAADENGATLQVVGDPNGSADVMLAAAQDLVTGGIQGIVSSVPNATMVKGLNDIIAGGVPVVQFNVLGDGVNAPYVGERSVESGRILGKAILDKLGGATATGDVVEGNCFPGYPVLQNRAQGVEESLAAAPGINVIGKGGTNDVKVAATDNYAAWDALLTANQDAVALIGLCAPDVASLGKLKTANPDSKFIAGGYDLTPDNLAQLAAGTAYISLGQTPFIQGYLPVKILIDSIRNGTTADLAKPGFIAAGTEIVTADSVTEPYDLPPLTFAELQALSADDNRVEWRKYFQPVVDGVIANWATSIEPIENESK